MYERWLENVILKKTPWSNFTTHTLKLLLTSHCLIMFPSLLNKLLQCSDCVSNIGWLLWCFSSYYLIVSFLQVTVTFWSLVLCMIKTKSTSNLGWKEDTNTLILRGSRVMCDKNCGFCEQINFPYPKISDQIFESWYGRKGFISR